MYVGNTCMSLVVGWWNVGALIETRLSPTIHAEKLDGIAQREYRRHGSSVLCAVTRARVH